MTPPATRTATPVTLALALALLAAAAVACGADGKPGGSPPAQAGRKAQDAPHRSVASYPGAVVSVIHPATGIRISVAPNGEDVSAVDRAGKTLWRTNPIERWGKPRVGAPVIRHLDLLGDRVQVTVGKHLVGEIDVVTGRDRSKGSD